MPQQIAVAFALCAFAVSIAAGLVAGIPASTVLLRSVVVLLAAGAMGRVLGSVAQVALNEHLTALTGDNPVPEPFRYSPPAMDAGDVEILEDVESP